MLVLYKNKPNSACPHSSRPTSSHSSQNNLRMEVRNKKNASARSHSNFPVQKMHHALVNPTDDMFSGQRAIRPHKAREFEDFSSNMFKQIGDMFGKMMFGDMGGHTPQSRNHGASRVISKTYVLSTKVDQNGRVYAEKYYSNDMAVRGADGTTIHERQQAYHNTGNNVQKIAEERRINNQAKKLMQQRMKGQNDVMRQVQYHNMHEDEIERFDQHWDHYAGQLGFYGGSRKRVVQDPQDIPFVPQSRNQYEPAYQRDFEAGQRGNVRNSPRVRRPENRNVVRNLNNDHGHGRVRRADIQPAIPERVLALPRNETHEDAPVRHREINARQNLRQNHREIEVQEHAGMNGNNVEHNEMHHEPTPRVRTANVPRRSDTGARGDGNFKNKHIPTAMPDAG